MNEYEKAPAIDDLLTWLSGKVRNATIAAAKCTTCETPNLDFKDPESRSEYRISGMCQNCQDVAFADPEDED